MYEVTFDPARKLVSITFRGHVVPAEVARGRAEVAAALATMPAGFRLLTDLSELSLMEYACAPEIEQTMDLFRDKGVTLVVRVIPDPKKDIGFKVMSYFHYGKAVPVLTYLTREEALAHLSA